MSSSRADAPNAYISTQVVYNFYRHYCTENGCDFTDSGIVIPEIMRYMRVDKKRHSTRDGRKMCLMGIKVREDARLNEHPE